MAFFLTTHGIPSMADDDPFLWLEDVQGDKALAWARERNAQSRARLESHPRFTQFRDEILQVLNARDRIPTVGRQGKWLYNFWQDDTNKRGLWRRTTL
ncbi:MAG TPA: S9 family peptidase, partial [Burkholderiaceae bacterium]|nr:S9 family peptidase [Burkholderiaceae bacterium]